MAVWHALRQTASFSASFADVTAGFTSFAAPTRTSSKEPVASFCCCLSVKRTERNLSLSPTTTAVDTPGSSDLSASSMGTGGTFSPPAVMSSSLMRPVILSMGAAPAPKGTKAPVSPEWFQPSASTASRVLPSSRK